MKDEFYFNLLDNSNINDSSKSLSGVAAGNFDIFKFDFQLICIIIIAAVNIVMSVSGDSIARTAVSLLDKNIFTNMANSSDKSEASGNSSLLKYTFINYKELENAFNDRNFSYLNIIIEDSLKFARKVSITPLTVMNLLETAHLSDIKILSCEFLPQSFSSKVKIGGIALNDTALSEYCARLSKMPEVSDFKFNMNAKKEKINAADNKELSWIDFSIECEIKKQ